jgi:hypothetical protein
MSVKWHSSISSVCSNNTIIELGKVLAGVCSGNLNTPVNLKAYRDMRDYAKFLQQCLPKCVEFRINDDKKELVVVRVDKEFKDGLKSLDSFAYELTFERSV